MIERKVLSVQSVSYIPPQYLSRSTHMNERMMILFKKYINSFLLRASILLLFLLSSTQLCQIGKINSKR